MYREWIAELAHDNPWVQIQPPCPESRIQDVEKVVGYPFPKELRELLLEMNGDHWLLMSAESILRNVELNREIFLPLFEEDFTKEAYMDRVDRFIYFATNGCGDYYCYRVTPDGIPDETTIYIWEHEYLGDPCCWKPVANNLREFITRYYHNEI